MNYRIESIFTLIAITISLIFIFFPGPFMMSIFLFIAQPLFIYVVGSIIIRFLREMRIKRIF